VPPSYLAEYFSQSYVEINGKNTQLSKKNSKNLIWSKIAIFNDFEGKKRKIRETGTRQDLFTRSKIKTNFNWINSFSYPKGERSTLKVQFEERVNKFFPLCCVHTRAPEFYILHRTDGRKAKAKQAAHIF
jgi:hypothetical protein